jgi:hypothetical protein
MLGTLDETDPLQEKQFNSEGVMEEFCYVASKAKVGTQ